MPTYCRCSELLLHLITLVTHSLDNTPLEEGSAHRRDLYLHSTQHSQETDIHAPARDSNPP